MQTSQLTVFANILQVFNTCQVKEKFHYAKKVQIIHVNLCVKLIVENLVILPELNLNSLYCYCSPRMLFGRIQVAGVVSIHFRIGLKSMKTP